IFSDLNKWCCPDCKEPCLPTLALGHWLQQTRLVQNDYSETDQDRMFRASFCPQCHHTIKGLTQPPFPIEWAPSNFTRWTQEKAFHPIRQGPPLVRKKVYQSKLVAFNAPLHFILSRTSKVLDQRTTQTKQPLRKNPQSLNCHHRLSTSLSLPHKLLSTSPNPPALEADWLGHVGGAKKVPQ
uniref:Uncharacterized protein n=1 Tax=Marmota marmota marmota TaxID=9994 RepID=A0A8C6EWZ3_MARMA